MREGQDGQPEAEPAAIGSLESVAEEQAAAEGAARQARVSFCASTPHISPFPFFLPDTGKPSSLGSSSVNAKRHSLFTNFFSSLLVAVNA